MTDRDKLINKLKAHDWWYESTEDRKVFVRGLAERSEIYELICKLPVYEVEPLLLEYVPEDCQHTFVQSLFAYNRNVNYLKERL